MTLRIDLSRKRRIAPTHPIGDRLTEWRATPLIGGYRPNSARCSWSTGPRKGGISPLGSPNDTSMGLAPGSIPFKSSASRANGEATRMSRGVSAASFGMVAVLREGASRFNHPRPREPSK